MRALALLGTLVLALSACGGGAEPESTPPPAPRAAPAPSPAATETAPGAASEADDPLAGTTLDGEQLGLDRFRGEYLFVNVWSSW